MRNNHKAKRRDMPTTMTPSRKHFWQLILLFGMMLAVLAIIQTEQQTEVLLKIRFRYKWLFVIGFFTLAFLTQAWLALRPRLLESISNWLKRLALPLQWGRVLGVVILAGSIPLMWIARFQPLGQLEPILGITLFAIWWLLVLQAFGLQLATGVAWEPAVVTMLALDGLLFQTYSIFQPVTAFPFSLGWSEASRYFYGSLPFSASLYGESLPLSFLHGTRYLMLSVPFLIQGLPLWGARLWQALLWLGVTGLTAWLAVRRLAMAPRWLKWLLAAWVFLFYFQGVVYYHLQVSVIFILAGVSVRRDKLSLLAIIAASFWAGMSRLNWFPVPAMLAIAIYLFETPLPSFMKIWRYLAKPALGGMIGIGAALLGQAFYIWWSRSPDLAAFGSSFSSDLLWYRLLPNETFWLGVIPGILLVSLPSVLFLYQALRGRPRRLHFIRLLSLAGMLIVLFAGGLVVSTKIGGGGDLHNMDAFLAMLSLIVLYFAGGAVELTTPASLPVEKPAWTMLMLLIVIPAAFAFLKVSAPIRYNQKQAEMDLQQLGQAAQLYSESGPVLFMYERHLLTFDMVPRIPLVNDYEVLTLMEMVISHNQPYLEAFHEDLEVHRFAAIIMRKSNLAVNAGDFLEENNAWNIEVAYQVDCEYQPVLVLDSSNAAVYVPREERQCPVVTEGKAQP